MVRDTSRIAYNDLKATGKQPKQKDIILNVLRDSINPMSLQEICLPSPSKRQDALC